MSALSYDGPERRQETAGVRLARLLIPLLVSVLVGIGSAAITAVTTTARLEARVSHLETKTASLDKENDIMRLRDHEFERRISRVEGVVEQLSRSLAEIGADIKTLLKQR